MTRFQRFIDRITNEIDYVLLDRNCMGLAYHPEWPTWRFSINECADCDSIVFGRFEFQHDLEALRERRKARKAARIQHPQGN